VKCEVKNVQSSEVFQVPPEGMVFGRAGGPANITVSDQSVSKRHARIYLKDGTWVLEDLKSVNGTVVNNRRITEPVPVQPGFVFALSKHQFEIVTADGAAPPMGTRSSGPRGAQNGNGNGAMAAEGMGGGSDPRRSRASSSQRPQRPGGPSQPVQVPDAEPLLPPEPQQSRGRGQPPPQPAFDDPGDEGAQQDAYLDEAVQSAGAGAVLAALPKAIAYYMAAVPLMALNPLGTIRKGAEEPKLKAMGPIELIAFILPVQIFANLITAWASGIGTLIGGGGFVVMSFIPIVQLIVAVVVSVVCGFLTHPLLKFFIDRLFKGESTDKTRTNYMIMTQTAAALLAIPTAVTLLLEPVIVRLSASISPIALLLIIPALLSAVTTPLTAIVAWRWMQAFRVLPIIQKICFVLVILSVLGGVARLASGVLYAINRMSAGGSVSTGGGGAADIDPEEAAKLAVAEAKKAGIEGDALKQIEENAKKAAEIAKAAAIEAKANEPKVDDKDKDPKADDKDKDPKVEDKDKDKDPKVEDKDKDKDPPNKDPDPPPKPVDATVKTTDPPPDPPPTVEEPPRGSGAFADYKRKREFVEQAIINDPSLLKNAKIEEAYKKLSRQTYLGIADAEEYVYGKKKRPQAELRLFFDRYKEMKIYERTRPVVDELYKLLKK
jgi:hypothetical protein